MAPSAAAVCLKMSDREGYLRCGSGGLRYDALYLASDKSAFVTASELAIDGGVTGIRP